VVAAHDDHEQPAVLDDDRVGLEQRSELDVQRLRDVGHRGHARRAHLFRGGQPVRQHDRLGLGARHLDVGGVAGRQRDVVLAGRARRHVLVGAEAAHRPDVGLDAVPLEADAVEDAVVRLAVALIVGVERVAVAVERVRVLHDELAGPEDAGARARLVALLRLEVVGAERQLPVGANERGHVEGHDLLVRQGQDHLGALAVLQLEHLVDVVAPGAAPQLGRVEHRREHLLGADRVELLADDPDDALVHPPAGGHPRPQPGADLADEAGADHQLVR
jgi:hypothetical protein